MFMVNSCVVGSQGNKVSAEASGMQRNHKVLGCLRLKQGNNVSSSLGLAGMEQLADHSHGGPLVTIGYPGDLYRDRLKYEEHPGYT